MRLGSSQTLGLQELKVTITCHAGVRRKVLYDEYGNRTVHGDHERTLHARTGIDEVISFLAIVAKAIPLKQADRC